MDGGSCLLSASVVYGAVSRSIPSSGKILKGVSCQAASSKLLLIGSSKAILILPGL